MIRIFISLVVLITLSGCFSKEEIKNIKDEAFGKRQINYYSDKTITPLEIPPDLTKPDTNNSFKLSDYVSDIDHKLVNFTNNKIDTIKKVRSESTIVKVRKSGSRRWLEIDKKPELVWELASSFFKEMGFKFEKMNLKTGIMETEFLENRPVVPDQSVGLIRSLIRKGTGQSYSLPSADKYKIRIEPIQNGEKSELYLSLFSIEEVVKNTNLKEGNTIWQNKEKDLELETEMLYRLMVSLGADSAKAREAIIQAKEEKGI